ncbi:MAG TPA: glutathione peroxidase [Chitinophagaceae bacterium]|nr:glutathione peroxidase [Chitinophagaceae bacterium]
MKRLLSRVIYFLLMKVRKAGDNAKELFNTKHAPPMKDFYSLQATLNNGTEMPFTTLKGKKVLIVNTASECGYTPQYEELEELYERSKGALVILGFPANDFGAQEPGDDKEIAQFCKINYGVTFPIMQKSSVIKGERQNPVFAWLTDSALNGWNNQQPEWNFNKYLVDEEGMLMAYFPSAVSPLSDEIIEAVAD